MLRTVSGQLGLRSHRSAAQRRLFVDDWLDRAACAIAIYTRRSRTRRALTELSDHHLRDIGLSRYDALEESRKPFWR